MEGVVIRRPRLYHMEDLPNGRLFTDTPVPPKYGFVYELNRHGFVNPDTIDYTAVSREKHRSNVMHASFYLSLVGILVMWILVAKFMI